MPKLRTAPRRPIPQILIVDDSPLIRRFVRELLEVRGCAVTAEVGTAWQAIVAVESVSPDAALVDLGLPDAHGGALALYLAQNHPGLVVVLMSAAPPDDKDALLKWTSAAGFVLKSELARVDLGSFWPWITSA